MKNLPNTEYIKIRRSKLQKYYNSTKRIRSAKYFDFIRSFYYDLYCCAFATSCHYYADGIDKIYYCRKSDIAEVFKNYCDNLPKFKNWEFWSKGDFDIARYYVPCDDTEATSIIAFFERGNLNVKQY